jgi:glycosyltransferase involved in cell wall biosynthesis
LPVIVSDIPATREIVEQAGCGFVVANDDAKGLREALAGLAADEEAARAMGSRGRAAVSRHYNWERDAAALLDLHESLFRGASV